MSKMPDARNMFWVSKIILNVNKYYIYLEAIFIFDRKENI